jgi:hypothetical protein
VECLRRRSCAGAEIVHLPLRGHSLGSKQQLAHASLHLAFGVDPDPSQVLIAAGRPVGSEHRPSA